MKRTAGCIFGLGIMLMAGLAKADATTQTDARDYEVLYYLPNNTVATLAYFRDMASSDTQSFTSLEGVFRAAYVLKFGNLAFVPFDAYFPVVDLTAYSGGTTLHNSAIADTTFLPTLAYLWSENDADQTHSYVAITPYVTAPTGNYEAGNPINVGLHRWTFQPQASVGQRFLKVMTFEATGNVGFHTANTDFQVPSLLPGTHSLKQKPTYGVDLHLAGDLSTSFYMAVSYYFVANGRSYFDLGTPSGVTLDETVTNQQTVQSLRFTWGVHVTLQDLLLLQFNQDVAASNGGTITRFFGIRFSHAFQPG